MNTLAIRSLTLKASTGSMGVAILFMVSVYVVMFMLDLNRFIPNLCRPGTKTRAKATWPRSSSWRARQKPSSLLVDQKMSHEYSEKILASYYALNRAVGSQQALRNSI